MQYSNQIGLVDVQGHPDNFMPQWCEKSVVVNFAKRFTYRPRICAAISSIDSESGRNLRIDVSSVDNISTTACTINVKSWGDSMIWGVKISWIASDDPNFLCGIERFGPIGGTTSIGGIIERFVPFDNKEFDDAMIPCVTASMSSLDLDCLQSYRAKVEVNEITAKGFTLKVSKSSESHVNSINVSWMASKTNRISLGHFERPLIFDEPLKIVKTPHIKREVFDHSNMVPLSDGNSPVVYIAQLSGIEAGKWTNTRIEVDAKVIEEIVSSTTPVKGPTSSTTPVTKKVKVSAITWSDSVTYSLQAAVIGAICSASLKETSIRMVRNVNVALPPDYELVARREDRNGLAGVLGEGSFARTYRVRNVLDQQLYCFKIFNSNVNLLKVKTEISLLAMLPYHVNIVRYYGAQKFEERFLIQTELIQGRPMTAFVKKPPCGEEYVLSWTRQLFDGLSTLHTKMAHRDLKGANILVVDSSVSFPHGLVKIIDLGNARVLSEINEEGSFSKRHEGMHCYFSPERCSATDLLDAKDDVWVRGIK